MKIIPAIDIYNGKCVRLLKGDYNLKKEYSSNPLLVAKEFENNGATHLHVVDLEGAKSSTIINRSVLQEICSNTDLKVDFGGGIKTKNDISLAFDLGVNQITLGSVAVTNKDLLIDSLNVYGKEKIILGADFLGEEVLLANSFLPAAPLSKTHLPPSLQILPRPSLCGLQSESFVHPPPSCAGDVEAYASQLGILIPPRIKPPACVI